MSDTDAMDKGVVTVVGNVREETFSGSDGEVRRGSKHFAAGAKVHFVKGYRGNANETITVVGQHRSGRKMLKIDMSSAHVHNWRAKVVYNPAVCRLLGEPFGWTQEPMRVAEGFAGMVGPKFVFAFPRPDATIAQLSESWIRAGHRLVSYERRRADLPAVVLYLDAPSRPAGIGRVNDDSSIRIWLAPLVFEDGVLPEAMQRLGSKLETSVHFSRLGNSVLAEASLVIQEKTHNSAGLVHESTGASIGKATVGPRGEVLMELTSEASCLTGSARFGALMAMHEALPPIDRT